VLQFHPDPNVPKYAIPQSKILPNIAIDGQGSMFKSVIVARKHDGLPLSASTENIEVRQKGMTFVE
jgi:hypothetical protein